MRYLDRVKWLDLYGVDLHPVLVSVNKHTPFLKDFDWGRVDTSPSDKQGGLGLCFDLIRQRAKKKKLEHTCRSALANSFQTFLLFAGWNWCRRTPSSFHAFLPLSIHVPFSSRHFFLRLEQDTVRVSNSLRICSSYFIYIFLMDSPYGRTTKWFKSPTISRVIGLFYTVRYIVCLPFTLSLKSDFSHPTVWKVHISTRYW